MYKKLFESIDYLSNPNIMLKDSQETIEHQEQTEETIIYPKVNFIVMN